MKRFGNVPKDNNAKQLNVYFVLLSFTEAEGLRFFS